MSIVNEALAPATVIVAQWERRLPALLLAVVILIAGWLVAKLARFGGRKVLRAVNFQVLSERGGLDGFLIQGGARTDTSGVLAALVGLLVFLMALVLALNTLALHAAALAATRVALFLPRLMAGVLVLAVGLYFARFVAQSVSSQADLVGLEDGPLLGRLAHTVVMIFVVFLVLDEIRIGQGVLRDTYLIVLSGVMLAFALAFGLGGQKWAAGLLERQWPRDPGRAPHKGE